MPGHFAVPADPAIKLGPQVWLGQWIQKAHLALANILDTVCRFHVYSVHALMYIENMTHLAP